MRVAMIDPSGFTLPYDRALCAGLRAAGAEVTLYTRPARPGEAPSGRSHFHRAGESRLGRLLPDPVRLAVKGLEYGVDAARLRSVLASDPPDVIHLQWMPVPLLDRAFVAALRSIAPVVATVHDTRPFRGSPSSRLQELGWGAAVASADARIVHTEEGRGLLAAQGLGPAERIDHGLLGPDWAPPAPAEELRVLLFGALKPYKGVASLLAAIERTSARLRVVGSPRMPLDALREGLSAEAAARVDWDLRWVPEDDAPGVLAAADVHVFPYTDVDASGALRTVLGRGPVIASAVGGPAELLTDGVDALLVPPGDPGALAQAIERTRDPGLREALLDGGRSTAEALPSWAEIGARTLALYRRAGATR